MKKHFTSFMIVLLVSGLGYSQDRISSDYDHTTSEVFQSSERMDWGESVNASGEWCTTGTFPDVPNATYFQASAWLGDTLYVHAPNSTGGATNTIYKYVMNGSWSTGISLPAVLVGGTLTACNGKLYYIGGSTGTLNGGPFVNTVYEYDPATGMWTSRADLPVSMTGHGAVSWGDSVIFVAGGPYTGSGTNLNVHYYRVTSNTWGTITNSLPAAQGRRTFAIGMVTGNKIIIAAGFNTAFLKTVWIGQIGSDASQISWSAGPDVPTQYIGLSRPGGTGIDKYFFLVNGERAGSGGYYDTTHVFDASLNAWVDIINNKPVKMSNIFNAVAAKLFNDTLKIFVPGGYGSLTGATPGVGFANFDVVACGNLIVIPVELVSFTADVNDGNVILKWITATELNNAGFEILRMQDNVFSKIGYVEGNGTTTETKIYSFTDYGITNGSYKYRLKQIDYDGTIAYSDIIEVNVLTPNSFALAQNYPNPFNPSTMISFGLAADSKVTLKIFDVLGQEVTTLVNGSLNAGVHNIDFNASQLNSGVYFYQIEAEGIDGSRFSEVKKMMLTK